MKDSEKKTSDRKLESNAKYLSKFKTVSVRIPLDRFPQIEAAASAQGVGVSAYMLHAAETGGSADAADDALRDALAVAQRAGQAAGMQPGPWLLNAATVQETRERGSRALLSQMPATKGATT